jgi:RNA polymerase sigma-70 factor (ECF subfamily)
VFLVAHRRPFQPRGEAQVTTWLFRIAQRVVMSHRRKRRLWQWLRGSSIDAAGDVPVSGPSPLEEYEKREAVTTAYRILDDMPEKYRTIILLFEFEGLSGEEIASLTGITLDNVWVRIHRARAQFLERLSRADRRAR